MRISKILLSSMLISLIFTSSAFAEDRVSLGFLYGWSGNLDLVDRTKGGINQVSPTCLDLDNQGNLVITSNLTHTFVDEMHSRGVLVTPFLSNHWARQKGVNAVKNAENLTNDILAVIEEYDLDGVNVDIENLLPENRDDLSDFVALLYSKMADEKILSVSVAANPFGKNTGWQGSYDYAKLGDNSDYLLLMTYDEHSQGGPAGPVSSYEFVEKSIIYARDYVVKEKLVLGIPFFGRYWKYDEEEEDYYGGSAVVIGAMPKILEAFEDEENKAEYDETIREAQFKFIVNHEEEKTLSINGEDLEDGEYVIWYPNHDAIKAKLALVNQYDLLGSGVWALGQEKVDVWEYFYDELNKTPRQVAKVEPEEVVEVPIVFAAQTVDLKSINESIKMAKSIIDTVLHLPIDNIIDENIQYKDVEPHYHKSFIDDVQFAKTIEKVAKTEKQKIPNLEKNKIGKKEVHRFRMEKVW